MKLAVKIPSPGKITKILIIAVLLLTFLSLLTVLLRFKWDFLLGERIFNLNDEANVPTWFSSTTLLFAAILAWLIARCLKLAQKPFFKSWIVVGCSLFFMSLDEFIQIHEAVGRVLIRTEALPSLGFNVWIIPGLALVLGVALIILRMWWNLPSRFRLVFLLATLVYFSGTLVTEAIGNAIWKGTGYNTVGFALFIHIEEVLEMLGVVILINGLMNYLNICSDQICFELQGDEPVHPIQQSAR
jgi:hypothetical protein